MVAYGSRRLGAATLYRRLRGRAHVSRWSHDASLEAEWAGRTAMIAELVPAGSHVIEFGAGRRQLEASLPAGCTYTPSDLVDRGPGTLVVDLNDRPLPNLSRLDVDVAVFAGVLEYLHHLEDVPTWLAEHVRLCIASYECANTKQRSLRRLRERVQRLRNGWITTYTETELVSLFTTAGLACTRRRTWATPEGEERIFVFERQ